MSEKHSSLSCDSEFLRKIHEFELLYATEKLKGFCVSSAFDNCENIPDLKKIFHLFQHTVECLVQNKHEELLKENMLYFELNVPDVLSTSNNFSYEISTKCISLSSKFPEVKFSPVVKYVKDFLILSIGLSALQVFVKSNILKPESKTENSIWQNYFPNFVLENIDLFLGGNSHLLSPNVQQKTLLLLSRLVLSLPDSHCITYHWWNIRCLMTHQRVLTEKNSILHSLIYKNYDVIKKQPWMSSEDSRFVLAAEVLLLVEMAQMHIYYQELKQASELIGISSLNNNAVSKFQDNTDNNLEESKTVTKKSACNLLSFNIKLHGALGKRTQFQTKYLPQLLVKIERMNDNDLWSDLSVNESFPDNLKLLDDTLLNCIHFENKEDNNVQEMNTGEQLVLFALCSLERNTVGDKLTEEQVLTYLEYLLEQQKVWSVHLMALVLRSKYEKKHPRRNDRAIRQMEAVIQHLKMPRSYLPMIYATGFPTFWLLEKELADILVSIGAVRSALDIYKRYNLWQELVACYIHLGRMAEAKELILEQLEIKKTPLLLCLLGDIEGNPEHYTSAFELSKQTCHHSQRSLGYWYYKQNNFKECIGYFSKSVELNHLQSDVWFALAFAASKIGDLDLASKAYRQLLQLDEDNFEAWNNLSAAYIGLGQKERAWRTLQEALRCNYNQHQVWENFLCVCVDVGAFDGAIRAYHRLLDLIKKHEDLPILDILVKAVSENIPDRCGKPASYLRQNLLELFGRLRSTSMAREHRFWELYSLLTHSPNDSVRCFDDLERAVDFQEKAVTYHLKVVQRSSLDAVDLLSLLKAGHRFSSLSLLYLTNLPEGKTENAKKVTYKLLLQQLVSFCEKQSNSIVEVKSETQILISSLVLEMSKALSEIKNL